MDAIDAAFAADLEKVSSEARDMARAKNNAKKRKMIPNRTELEGDCPTSTETSKIAAQPFKGTKVLVGKQVDKAQHKSMILGAALSSALGLPVAYEFGHQRGASRGSKKKRS